MVISPASVARDPGFDTTFGKNPVHESAGCKICCGEIKDPQIVTAQEHRMLSKHTKQRNRGNATFGPLRLMEHLPSGWSLQLRRQRGHWRLGWPKINLANVHALLSLLWVLLSEKTKAKRSLTFRLPCLSACSPLYRPRKKSFCQKRITFFGPELCPRFQSAELRTACCATKSTPPLGCSDLYYLEPWLADACPRGIWCYKACVEHVEICIITSKAFGILK